MQYDNPIMLNLKLLLITFILITISTSLTASFNVGIIPASTSTSKQTSYVFQFIISSITSGNISTGSYLTVAFPSDYPLTSLTGITGPGADDNCSTVSPSSLTLSPSARVFRINGAFPADQTDDFILQFTMSGITHPNRVKTTAVFTMSLYTSASVLTLTDSTQVVTTTPGSLTCSMVPTFTEVQATSPYLVTITPNTAIPFDGVIKMVLPTYWPNDQVRTTTVLGSTISCVNSVNTSASLSCSLSGQTITVINMFSSSTANQFQFRASSITNPTSTEPIGPITISSYDSFGSEIDQCSVLVTGVTPSSLSQVTYTTVSSSVSTSTVSTLKFTTTKILQVNDHMRITFPSTFDLSQLVNSFMIIGSVINSASIASNVSNVVTTTIPITVAQSPSSITFTFSNVTTPPSILPTSNFIVSTLRNGYAIQTVSCCSFTATTGALTVTITAGSYQAGATTQYTFNITTANKLAATAQVEVVFPSQYTIASSTGTCLSATGTNVSTTPTCTIVSPRTLTISNLLTSELGGGNSFSVVAGSISNPSQALTTSNFIVSTIYSASGGYTDVNSNIQVTITPSIISSVTVQASNYVNNQPANYTLTINNTNALSPGSILQIQVPSLITVGSISCFVSVTTPVTCALVSSNVLNVSDVVNSTLASGALASSPLTIVGLTNPISFQPTSSFGVTIYTSSFVAIEALSTGITVTMNVSTPFSPISITPSSFLTGALTPYTITFSTPYTMTNNSNLTISFPSQFNVSSPVCSALNHLTTVDCTLTNSPVSMVLPLTISTNTASLRITSVVNPLSLATPTAIIVFLYTGGYLSLQSSVVVGPFTTNLITYSVAQTSQYIGEGTSLTVTITTTNQLPPTRYLSAAGYLTITVPVEYNTNSMACGAITGVAGAFCAISSGAVKVSGTSFQTSITVDLNGLVNPSASTSSFFSVRTYDASNNDIDSASTNYKYSVPCTLPCRSCTTTLTSCLSCYTSTTLQTVVSNQKFLTQSTCATACNTSSYSDSNSICFACSSSCKTCSLSASNCTTCPTTLPYILNNVCYSSCPFGYYIDTTLVTCELCINNCKSCTTSTLCLSCATGFYLNGTSCIGACPSRTYVQNNVCINCSSNCATCDSTGCLTCDSTYLLYSGICYTTCPQGVYISGSICTNCNTSCQTCSTTANTCSACISTGTLPYLHSGSCLNQCPAGYYPDNYKCVVCVDPCLECTTLTGCTKCVSGRVLYQSSCTYTTCPGNTIQIGSECFDCTSPCLTCSVSQTFCTLCIENNFLDNNGCVPSCPANLFGINGKCVTCAEPCLFCTVGDPYSCNSCIANYYLLGTVCYLTCPSGTYTSAGDSKCKTCATGCLTCTNATNCTSCISGLYLYNFFCYSTCPSVPIYYYAYQSMCIACQPQCTSCLATPVQCVSCSSSAYLHNVVTKTCMTTCQAGYYQNGTTTCVPCQLPCKTCDTVFDSCASCYNGYFLHQGACSDTCPYNYYKLDTNNSCVGCIFPCLECNNYKCLKCDSSTSYYNGSCYTVCPSNVPYSLYGYCTNCQALSYCLECSSGKCSECVEPYFLYLGECVKSCPPNYQSDATNTSCIMTAEYIKYLNSLEVDKRKNLPFPFLIVFICFSVTLLIGKCQNKQIYYVGSIISFAGIMQFLSWILFLVFLIIYGSTLTWLPYLVGALFAVNFLFNCLNLIPIFKIYREDKRYKQWLKERNSTKQKIIIAVSVIMTFKFSRALFCRYFDLPSFSARLLGVDKFYWWNRLTCVSFVFVEGMAIAVAVLAAYNEPLFYTKVFFASIQVFFFSILEICVEAVDLRKDEKNFFKQPQSDPLRGLSAKKLRGCSQYSQQEEVPKLGRTRSEMKLNPQITQFQLADDDYISVYDPDDYEEVPQMENSKIPKGIQKGKFRRKNKKKLVDLWSIAEISSDDSSEQSKKKKRKGRGPQGFMNNYLYWKPPKVQKVKVKPKDGPLEIKKADEAMIFETIRNKESEFDILSQQEDLFVERNAQPTRQGRYQEFQRDASKFSIDVSMSQQPMIGQQGSRTNPHSLTFMFDPDDLMNLNYAKKKHIERRGETIVPPSSEESKRPFSRIGGMILKNLKR